MSYPLPSLLSLLQFHCTPDEYQRIISPYLDRWGNIDLWGSLRTYSLNIDYWRIIPTYTYAYCPVCQAQYQDPVDTYSIRGWSSYQDLMKKLYISTKPLCPHFLGIHAFINPHDNLPRENRDFNNYTGELPYITPWYFQYDVPMYAVLHALPICCIEANQFVPSYTVFSLTYFSQDLRKLLRYRSQEKLGEGDPEYYPSTVYPPGSKRTKKYDETLYDLAQWAKRGQLGWLDYSEADLPLRLGIGEELPKMYRHIEGKRWQYVWTDGQISPL